MVVQFTGSVAANSPHRWFTWGCLTGASIDIEPGTPSRTSKGKPCAS